MITNCGKTRQSNLVIMALSSRGSIYTLLAALASSGLGASSWEGASRASFSDSTVVEAISIDMDGIMSQ